MKKRLCSFMLGLTVFGFSASPSFAVKLDANEADALLNIMFTFARGSYLNEFKKLNETFKCNPKAKNRFPYFFWNDILEKFKSKRISEEIRTYSDLSTVFVRLVATRKRKNNHTKNQIGPALFAEMVCDESIIDLKYDNQEIIKPIRSNIENKLNDEERQSIVQQLQAIIRI